MSRRCHHHQRCEHLQRPGETHAPCSADPSGAQAAASPTHGRSSQNQSRLFLQPPRHYHSILPLSDLAWAPWALIMAPQSLDIRLWAGHWQSLSLTVFLTAGSGAVESGVGMAAGLCQTSRLTLIALDFPAGPGPGSETHQVGRKGTWEAYYSTPSRFNH